MTRRLLDTGADVRVVMTEAAAKFVTPLTFQALSGHTVYTSFAVPQAEHGMDHVELGRWADCILIAPATADVLAKLAHGRGDDLLSAVCLATDSPIAVAPAMNRQMWDHPATQDNCDTLQNRGVQIMGPADGQQACGDTGEGRMLEPLQLVHALEKLFKSRGFHNLKVLITAGPTREAIDPVRYVSNRSSGRMGYALAQAALEAGAVVTLVSGPVTLEAPKGTRRIDVESAEQMLEAVMREVAAHHIFIACAAVADYRVAQAANNKIKKAQRELTLRLIPNPDILASVAALNKAPFTVGFAAETDNLIEYARQKLREKRLDLVAANLVGTARSGFEGEENALQVIWHDGQVSLPKTHKHKLARQLVDIIATRYMESHKYSNIISLQHAKNRSQDTR